MALAIPASADNAKASRTPRAPSATWAVSRSILYRFRGDAATASGEVMSANDLCVQVRPIRSPPAYARIRSSSLVRATGAARYVGERLRQRGPHIDHRRQTRVQRLAQRRTQRGRIGDAHAVTAHGAGDRRVIEVGELRRERAAAMQHPAERLVVEHHVDDRDVLLDRRSSGRSSSSRIRRRRTPRRPGGPDAPASPRVPREWRTPSVPNRPPAGSRRPASSDRSASS